jgi:hypothetical protein
MMPAHCKTVSFKRVGFPLTAKEIERQLAGKKVFTRTDYFILENSGNVAVARVSKKRGIELFREVTSVEVLSLPESTVMVTDPSCDVLDVHSSMYPSSREERSLRGCVSSISSLQTRARRSGWSRMCCGPGWSERHFWSSP